LSTLLVALLGVLLIPLFVATWRTSLLALSLQGLLMGWIAHGNGLGASFSPAAILTFADLVVVRGLLAPLLLRSVLVAQNAPARNDVIPANLLSWTMALGIVLLAFRFGEALVPVQGDQQTLVAVATAGLLLGFLVLTTHAGALSQVVGALRIENAIALFELGGEPHHEPLALKVGQVAVYAATVLLFRWYLTHLGPGALAEPARAPEEPTL
jgi:hydrogenase-4 component E